MEGNFHDKLKLFIHKYILLTYKLSKKYPSEERYGLMSQDQRSSVSVMLNYVEGYARMKNQVTINFLEISYASLKESIYCKFLAFELDYINKLDYEEALSLKEKIGAMLYKTIDGLKNKCN